MNETGPFLRVAAICEKVLQETDGVVSAIRLIDRLTFFVGPDGQPLQPRAPISFMVAFMSGQARGSYPVEIVRERPSTERSSVVRTELFFEGEDRGAQMIINAVFEPVEPGLYWFDVLFSDACVTRIPLRAIYQTPPMTGLGE